MTASPAVDVCIVSHGSAADLPVCLASVAALEHRPLAAVVVDCASADGSAAVAETQREALAAKGVALTVEPLADNAGFAAAMNRALALSAGDSAGEWVLSLNPDARPAPNYLSRLLARAAAHPELRVGAVTGRLVREAPGGGGAPALDDAAVEGEAFDPLFHSFREDAELAFRLRERGWEVLYEPAARAVHRRWSLPERRRSLPPEVNRHSLKNRYLLRLHHQTAANLRRTLPWALGRDLAALAWVLAAERSSLPAYGWLWRHRREILARRRAIQARRTVPARELDRWFGCSGMPL